MKTVIVTGASRGIGEAIVRCLRVRGCRVIGISRSEPALRALSLEKLGPGTFEYVAGDVCESATLRQAVELAIANDSSLDGLILNAGTAQPMDKCANLSMTEFRRAFDVNMFSAVELCKLALPHLRRSRGRIVFTSTGVAELPMTAWSPYCSSKAAMNMYIRCLAREEQDVVCMAVRPGIVETAMVQGIYSDPHCKQVMDPEQFAFMSLQRDHGRLLKPEVPAEVMARLVLEAPASLSGEFFSWDDVRAKRMLSAHDSD